jgi:predicted DNA-binding protein (UPF0251 family)
MKDKFYKWDKFIGSYHRMPDAPSALEDHKVQRKVDSHRKVVKDLPAPSNYFTYDKKAHEEFVFKPTRKGKRKLTDAEVIWARHNIKDYTYEYVAAKLEVSRLTLQNAVRGITYKHLNKDYKPQW